MRPCGLHEGDLMRLLTSFAVVLLSVFSGKTVAQDATFGNPDLDVKTVERFEQLTAKYGVNRSQFERYAVIVACENTIIDRKTPANSRTDTAWYGICVDSKNEFRRFDSSQNYGRLRASTYTYVSRGDIDKFKYYSNGEYLEELDLRVEEDKEDCPSLTSFDPWNLPFNQLSSLVPRGDPRVGIDRPWETRWTRFDVQDTQETPSTFAVELLLDKKSQITLDVGFDKKHDDLPVQSQISIQEPDGWKGTMARTVTRWALHKDVGWVPATISISSTSGNPSRPSGTHEASLTLYWLLGESVPGAWLDDAKFVKFAEIKNYVLQHSRTQELAAALNDPKSKTSKRK